MRIPKAVTATVAVAALLAACEDPDGSDTDGGGDEAVESTPDDTDEDPDADAMDGHWCQ